MAELYDIWNGFWNNIPVIKNKIDGFAKLSGLTSDEALMLLAINRYPAFLIENEKKFLNRLCEKGLCEYTEKGAAITNKGKIIFKSLESSFKKL